MANDLEANLVRFFLDFLLVSIEKNLNLESQILSILSRKRYDGSLVISFFHNELKNLPLLYKALCINPNLSKLLEKLLPKQMDINDKIKGFFVSFFKYLIENQENLNLVFGNMILALDENQRDNFLCILDICMSELLIYNVLNLKKFALNLVGIFYLLNDYINSFANDIKIDKMMSIVDKMIELFFRIKILHSIFPSFGDEATFSTEEKIKQWLEKQNSCFRYGGILLCAQQIICYFLTSFLLSDSIKTKCICLLTKLMKIPDFEEIITESTITFKALLNKGGLEKNEEFNSLFIIKHFCLAILQYINIIQDKDLKFVLYSILYEHAKILKKYPFLASKTSSILHLDVWQVNSFDRSNKSDYLKSFMDDSRLINLTPNSNLNEESLEDKIKIFFLDYPNFSELLSQKNAVFEIIIMKLYLESSRFILLQRNYNCVKFISLRPSPLVINQGVEHQFGFNLKVLKEFLVKKDVITQWCKIKKDLTSKYGPFAKINPVQKKTYKIMNLSDNFLRRFFVKEVTPKNLKVSEYNYSELATPIKTSVHPNLPLDRKNSNSVMESSNNLSALSPLTPIKDEYSSDNNLMLSSDYNYQVNVKSMNYNSQPLIQDNSEKKTRTHSEMSKPPPLRKKNSLMEFLRRKEKKKNCIEEIAELSKLKGGYFGSIKIKQHKLIFKSLGLSRPNEMPYKY